MSTEVLLVIALGTLVLVSAGSVVAMGILLTWTLRTLMWFHRAGGQMVNFELQKAEIEIREKEADVQIAQAEVEKERLRIHGGPGRAAHSNRAGEMLSPAS